MKIVKGKYIVENSFIYYSYRYNKSVYIEEGFKSNGADCAIDIASKAWIVHDKLLETWQWDDGTPCTNFQASMILHDILLEEGRWFRARSWFVATLLYGPIRSVKKKIFKP